MSAHADTDRLRAFLNDQRNRRLVLDQKRVRIEGHLESQRKEILLCKERYPFKRYPFKAQVYKRIQMYTNVYKSIQIYTNLYKSIQMYTKVYKCIQMYRFVYVCTLFGSMHL